METQPHARRWHSQSMQFATMAKLFLILCVLFSNVSCGANATATPETPTEPPGGTESPTEPPGTTEPATQPVVPATVSVEEKLEQVQWELNQSLRGHFAYSAPATMKLNETLTVELRINPSLSGDMLATQIVESSGLVTSTADPGVLLSPSGAKVNVAGSEVEITPMMRAILLPDDTGNFDVQPLHADQVQPVGKDTTTTWQWLITARRTGTHRLLLIIYRQINVDGKEYWPTVQTHQAPIDVQVTFDQWLGLINWEWLAGILITALLIPAFWRWMDQRRKRKEEVPKAKNSRKKG